MEASRWWASRRARTSWRHGGGGCGGGGEQSGIFYSKLLFTTRTELRVNQVIGCFSALCLHVSPFGALFRGIVLSSLLGSVRVE